MAGELYTCPVPSSDPDLSLIPQERTWLRIHLPKGGEDEAALEDAYYRSDARRHYQIGDYSKALQAVRNIQQPTPADISLRIEALSRDPEAYAELGQLADNLPLRIRVAYLCGLLQWLKSLPLGASSTAELLSDEASRIRGRIRMLAHAGQWQVLEEATFSALAEQIESEMKLRQSTSPAAPSLEKLPSLLDDQKRVTMYLHACAVGRSPSLLPADATIRSWAAILFHFRLYETELRDPALSPMTDLATLIRNVYEQLINRIMKQEFLGYLKAGNVLDDFRRACKTPCSGKLRDACLALGYTLNPERNLRPGEWTSFLTAYQRNADSGSCRRLEHFRRFIDEKGWRRLFDSEAFRDSIRRIFSSKLLSALVHHPQTDGHAYQELRSMYCEQLTGIEMEKWLAAGVTELDSLIDRTAIFPVLIEPGNAYGLQ